MAPARETSEAKVLQFCSVLLGSGESCYNSDLLQQKLLQLCSAAVKESFDNKPHKRFIGQEESRRVAASARVE